MKSENGSSGGGLFDPDGFLVGVRSGSPDNPIEVEKESGLLGGSFVVIKKANSLTTSFFHPAFGEEFAPAFAWDQSLARFKQGINSQLSEEDQKVVLNLFLSKLGERPQ